MQPFDADPVRPIIFSPEMVRLIRAGEKTQTRRVVRPSPRRVLRVNRSRPRITITAQVDDASRPRQIECPHTTGDILWVRESWAATFQSGGVSNAPWAQADRRDRTERRCTSLWYEADSDLPHRSGEWVSPIFMPRWAARLAVRIDAVRAEPLQDLSAFDISDEGLPLRPVAGVLPDGGTRSGDTDLDPAHMVFRARWNSIHADASKQWESNPWVWVYEFTPGLT